MQRYERLSAILEVLADRGKLSVEEIAASFGVSVATVRRDLEDLAEQGLITRTRGGAVLENVAYDLPLRYKSVRQPDEKQRIAVAAAALVRPGMVVGINGGTTTSAVARAIATRPDLSGDNAGKSPQVTIVTNALNIANEMVVRPHVKVVLTGGVARPQSYELIGPLASRVLAGLTTDLLLLGVNAISGAGGAAAHHEGEAEVNRLMVQGTKRAVVVADGSKIGQHAFAQICAAEQISMLLTDASADPDAVADLKRIGVEVQTV